MQLNAMAWRLTGFSARYSPVVLAQSPTLGSAKFKQRRSSRNLALGFSRLRARGNMPNNVVNPDLPVWQTDFQHTLDSADENKFVQVATVTEDGRPACRTMGFCGFIPGTQQALLQTHSKSFKAGHLARSNWVEICNWNLPTQQQLRLRGAVSVVDADSTNQQLQEIRQKEYQKLDTPSVLQWYNNANRAPGRAFQPPAQHHVDKQGPVPPSFLLLVVDVTEVDHVLLEPDTRAIWTKQNGVQHKESAQEQHSWQKQDVNP